MCGAPFKPEPRLSSVMISWTKGAEDLDGLESGDGDRFGGSRAPK